MQSLDEILRITGSKRSDVSVALRGQHVRFELKSVYRTVHHVRIGPSFDLVGSIIRKGVWLPVKWDASAKRWRINKEDK